MNERTCIVTRESGPPDGLIRFVAGPDGFVVPDLKARLPGRGAWVTGRAETVARAARSKAFARALKQPVRVPDDLAEAVDRLLERRALEALGLAARAGAVVTGFAKVEAAALRGKLALVLEAADGAADGRRKIAAAVGQGPLGRAQIATVFTSEQISLALGRSNVIHAGVAPGRAAASLEAAILRLERYRDGGAGGARAAQAVGSARLNGT